MQRAIALTKQADVPWLPALLPDRNPLSVPAAPTLGSRKGRGERLCPSSRELLSIGLEGGFLGTGREAFPEPGHQGRAAGSSVHAEMVRGSALAESSLQSS